LKLRGGWGQGARLKHNSILTLMDELFSTRFVAGKRERKTSIHIAKVQQAKGEDLKEYVVRFNREAI